MRDISEVQRLAEEYASYSVSKSGLGNVLGGIVGIIIYVINGLWGRGLLTTIVTLLLTLIWLVGKELIRRFLYRSFGEAHESWSEARRRYQFSVALFSVLAAIGLWIWFILAYIHLGSIPLVGLLLGLAIAASTPWIIWRYLRTSDELMVGTFLLLCCAIVSLGAVLGQTGLAGWATSAWVPLYALIMLSKGVEEHRRFHQLARQLRTQEAGL